MQGSRDGTWRRGSRGPRTSPSSTGRRFEGRRKACGWRAEKVYEGGARSSSTWATRAAASCRAIAGIAPSPSSSMMAVDFLPSTSSCSRGSYVGLKFAQMYPASGARSRSSRGSAAHPAQTSRRSAADLRAGEHRRPRPPPTLGAPRGRARHAAPRRGGDHPATTCWPSWVGSPTPGISGSTAGTCTADARRGYVEVDDALRTSVPRIWAIRDCNRRSAFTSYNDEIVAQKTCSTGTRAGGDRPAPHLRALHRPAARPRGRRRAGAGLGPPGARRQAP